MTRDELQRRTSIQQAFLDGKPCQVKLASGWFNIKANNDNGYEFDWNIYDYRVKPEPRVIYLADYDGRGVIGSIAWNHSEGCRTANSGARQVAKFVEVLE